MDIRQGNRAAGCAGQSAPEAEVEVQAIQVGPVVLVSNPSEYFVQYGLEIKKGSKFPFTFPVELANGCTGYVRRRRRSARTAAVMKRASLPTVIWRFPPAASSPKAASNWPIR